jgi:transcriptional regulator with XRE-family HTH domain
MNTAKMSRVTLKDIAIAAKVSKPVVSNILNNKGERFHPETRKKVWRLAREMNYRPNRLARAMISGTSPIVALSLHVESVFPTGINFYLHDIIPAVAFALNKAGFEMLFQPFTTHAEQYHRLDELISERLIGGVISNYIPGKQKKLIDFLNDKKLPFIILGDNLPPSVPSVHIDTGETTKIIKDYALRRGLDQETVHLMFSTAIPNQLMILDKNDWRKCTAKDEKRIFTNSNMLLSVPDLNTKSYLVEHKKITPDNILLIHDDRIPVLSKPALLVKSLQKERAEKAAELIAEWMTCGKMSPQKQWSIKINKQKQHLTLLE